MTKIQQSIELLNNILYSVNMSQVLYRKYRTQTFDELLGQGHISTILKNAVKKDSLSHAYLFTGSRGTGKTSTARILVKAINCLNRLEDGNPCNECDSCKAITAGRFLDLIEIDAASNRGIDQIRELKEKIEFSPVEGKYKIYIIDEVHMLTTEAFNALLKTLEEPPAHVIFILATTDVHKLPATILSRCQRYDFRLGSEDEIRELILGISKKEKIKIADEAVKILVHNAKGSFRDALSLLDVVYSGQLESEKPKEISEVEVRQILGIPDSTMVYYFLEKIVLNDKVAALEMINEIDRKGVNLQQFVKYTLVMLREILVQKMQEDLKVEEYSFAKNLSLSEIIGLVNAFVNVERNLKYTSIPILEFEMLIGSMNLVEKIAAEKKEEVKVVKEVKKEKVEKIEKEIKEEVKEEEKEKVVESKVPKSVVKKSLLDIKKIKKDWKILTNKIKPANGHLFAFLESVNVVSFDDEKLLMEVPFQFHKDRIEDPRSREAVANVCKEVFGECFSYECVVNNNMVSKKQVEADFILRREPEAQPKEVEKKSAKNVEDIFKDM
jgi:DNA polymerase III subunit gamma/tau